MYLHTKNYQEINVYNIVLDFIHTRCDMFYCKGKKEIRKEYRICI